jgi:hypothetical protein
MYNPMKIGCPKCNPRGHKSPNRNHKYNCWFVRCDFCHDDRFVDWIELATGGKKFSDSDSNSSTSSSSSQSSHIKPIRRKNDYVQNQKNVSITHGSPFVKTQR